MVRPTNKVPIPSSGKLALSIMKSCPEEPASSQTGSKVYILESMDKSLFSFDTCLAQLEILHKDFLVLQESGEFSQHQVETFAAENTAEKLIQGGSQAVIVFDKLNIKGQLCHGCTELDDLYQSFF